jgi:hypothetical protein
MAITIDGTVGVTYPAGTTGTLAALGDGQTWTSVTGSRAYGTTYTNSTGKPIAVSTWGSSTSSGGNLQATVAGLVVSFAQKEAVTNTNINSYFIVPSGATYSVASNSVTLVAWVELR